MSEDNYQIQILSRAISVLFSFSDDNIDRTLEDLASELSINKASLLRILRTFETERFVVRSGNSYRLGPRVLELGSVFLSTLSVHAISQPYMERLAKETQQTVSLALLDDQSVVYIAIEHAQREVGIQGQVGGRHPAHATALGKVLLSDLSDDELSAHIASSDLQRLTHRTIVDETLLMQHIKKVRSQDHAFDDEERGIGIRCVAAPVRNHERRIIAAISVAGPIFHMTDEVLEGTKDRVIKSAAEISRGLGYPIDSSAEVVS